MKSKKVIYVKTNLKLSYAWGGFTITSDTLLSSCFCLYAQRLESSDMTVCCTNMLILD